MCQQDAFLRPLMSGLQQLQYSFLQLDAYKDRSGMLREPESSPMAGKKKEQ
jgi:hypothetical protein